MKVWIILLAALAVLYGSLAGAAGRVPPWATPAALVVAGLCVLALRIRARARTDAKIKGER